MQAAAIVEPRNHAALPLVVFNVLAVLEPHWIVYIFHGTQNVDLCQSLQEMDLTRIRLVPLGVANLTIHDYNMLLCGRWFWEQIVTTSHILIFQTDALLTTKSPHKIDDFMQYDYIGAPWNHIRGLVVGNGGLSLRRKQAMVDAVTYFEQNQQRLNQQVPEDVRISRFLHKFRYVVPKSLEIAKRFAVERVYYERPFGVHAAYKKLPRYQWQKLVQFDPIFAQIEHLNE